MAETILSYWLLLLVLVAIAECLEARMTQTPAPHVGRWPANLALLVIASGIAAAVPVGSFAAAHWAAARDIGLLPLLGLPLWLLAAVSFLALSLWDYLAHLAAHKIPFLWRFHKIHHSDWDLDVTTAYRNHPVLALLLLLGQAAFCVSLGVLAEAVIIQKACVVVFEIAHHTRLRMPARLDAALRPYLITPSLHHIHHSDDVRETDTNYGQDLAIWDRLFGTYQPQPIREPADFRFGLAQYPQARADDLDALLRAPFGKDPNG